MKPPLNLIISDNEFELIAVGTKHGSSKGEPRWLVRHGGRFQGFWLIEKSEKFAKKTEGCPTDALETFIRGYWTIAIYQRSRNVELIDLKWKFLSTLTGQGIFICAHHTIPLTRDFRNSAFQCRCSRASFLRCPHLQCYSSVCKRHFNEGLQQQHRRILIDSVPLEKLNKTNTPSLVSESSSSRDLIEPNSMPANEPIQPDAAAETLDIASSNSSSVSYIVHPETNVEEFEDDNLRIMATLKTNPDEKLISVDLERKEDAFKLPLHILLNSQCNLLYRRNGNPISLSLKKNVSWKVFQLFGRLHYRSFNRKLFFSHRFFGVKLAAVVFQEQYQRLYTIHPTTTNSWVSPVWMTCFELESKTALF